MHFPIYEEIPLIFQAAQHILCFLYHEWVDAILVNSSHIIKCYRASNILQDVLDIFCAKSKYD